MKKIILLSLMFLMFTPIVKAQDINSRLMAQYQVLVTREKEITETLEETKRDLQRTIGAIQERRLADNEIATLNKKIEELEKKEKDSEKE